MGTDVSMVPPCVLTANIQNDPLEISDKVVILLCPLYSEVDYVKRVLDEADMKKIPVIMVNPNLINPDQGFGVRKSFSTCYFFFK